MATNPNTSNQPTVIFVGKRRGAFEAARRAAVRVVLVADKAPGPKERDLVAAYYPVDLAAPAERWTRLATEIDRLYDIAAVLALGEQTVMPAALLRQGLGLPGLDPTVAQRCTDKLVMKQTVRQAGLTCTDFLEAGPSLNPRLAAARLGYPLVMKTRIGSGGRGRAIISRPTDLPTRFPANTQVERFVRGVEMSVESLVHEGQPIFTNLTEYFKPGWANILPAELPAQTATAIRDFNAAAITALGVERGFAHLEIFLTEQGIYFGELAARPPGGYIMELIANSYGFDPWLAWLELELGQTPHLSKATGCAGIWLLHPGAGLVDRIIGVEAARALAGVERVSLRVEVGDELGERLGTGQEAGHILVNGPDRESVAEVLALAHNLIQIEVVQPEAVPF